MTTDEDKAAAWARGTVQRTMRRRQNVQAQAAIANDVLWRRGYPLPDGHMPGPCDHPTFSASVTVDRLTETDGGPVTHYAADIKVKCARCGLPFRFVGVPGGLHPGHPTTSLAGDELRAPLEPMPDDMAFLLAESGMTRPKLVIGHVTEGVWCPTCNAATRIRIPLHNRGRHTPVLADVEVCASCGHHYMPTRPAVATITRRRSWHWRPIHAAPWWIHEHNSRKHGRQAVECGWHDCQRPGWWECAWIEQVDFGNIRHVFCSGRHRRLWLAEHFGIPTD